MAEQRAEHDQGSIGIGRVDIPGFDRISAIGTGGSATVYRAHDQRHQRWVALKVLDPQANDERQRRAFDREIQAMGRIGNHPHIVTVLASGFTPANHPYLVLPLFERGTFAEVVDQHGPFTWADAIDIGVKLCSAVETVHRAGVVHRDIKPGNVFVGVSPAQPLLGDFGISSVIGSERTRTSTMAVTFGYTAPEVLDDERPTTASDIYSLGMTVYRLIQGLPAYYAETPAAVMRQVLDDGHQPQLSAGVPPGLAEVVLATLATDPGDRPESALRVARRLQAVQTEAGLPVTDVLVADEAPAPTGLPRPGPIPPPSGLPVASHPPTGRGKPPPGGRPAQGGLPRPDDRPALEDPPSPPNPPADAGSARPADTGDGHLGPGSAVGSRAHRVGTALAAALGHRDPGPPPSSNPPGVGTGTAWVEGEAIPPAVVPPGPGEGSDRAGLDLPTTFEPRSPRPVRQRRLPETSNTGWFRQPAIAAAVLVVLAALTCAVLAYQLGWWTAG